FNTTDNYPYILDNYGPRIRFPLVSEGLILMQAAQGVYISHNEGVNWTRLKGLPFFNFTFDPILGQNPTIGGYTEGAQFYHTGDGYLYAVTEGQGIWRTELAPIRDHALVNGGKFGFLQGQLYRDLDSSCDYNTTNGDVPLGHKPLTLQPGNITAITDANGKYSVALPPGNYTMSAAAPLYHSLSCTIGQPYAVSAGTTTEANMVFQPEPGIKDLCVLFTTPVRARPGFLVHYTVQVNNVGTTIISGAVLTVDFDAPWLEASTISPFGQYVGNQAIISIPDLAPGQVMIFTLNFSVSVNTPIGTDLSFLALCPVAEDAHPTNNRVVVIQTVTGSFDPNDKTAQPVQAQLPFQPRNFDYLIRFQNTGTDTAFTVVVTDTLDHRFELLSLRTLETSHAFEFQLLEGRVAKWIFRNILLPDSNTNEVASHGYIRFQIETKSDALPGIAIPNDADIFFDFNSPVRTNESFAENPKWLVMNTASVALCEGDSWNGSIWESSTTLIDTTSDVWSDTILLTEILVSPIFQLQLDTTITTGETIFGIPVLQDTAFVFQYQSAESCDSTITWNVTALTSGTKDILEQPIHVEIFPNPTAREVWLKAIRVDTEAKMTLKIRVLDTTGRLWQEMEGVEIHGSEAYKLSIEGLPGGVYFIEIQTPDFSTTRRLLKI
ncbi:MAG: T9SS type A sorting domain-containing protein, partial [Saprospiraceae bacterium]|nr:T9SS type A sorting domain-containing protein [Saprospiraceae bacterium]